MPESTHTVQRQEQGMRLDTLLATLEGIESRSDAVKYIERGKVALNGALLTAKSRQVLEGDVVTYRYEVDKPILLEGEDIKLDIRFEDDSLIVLSKPAGLVVHPAGKYISGTLVNALINHCGYENLAQLQGDDRPGIIHRLDKDTSGLMLAAKNNEVGKLLQDEIRYKNVERYYIALLHGIIAPNTGLVDAPLARDPVDKQKVIVADVPNARPSVTTFSVLERFDAQQHDVGYTLVECKLHTGRTHQIRVHMEYIGHACVGDPLYGTQNRPKAQQGLTRQFLHSWHLSFTHPVTTHTWDFYDQLPEELMKILSALQPHSRGRTAYGSKLYEMFYDE